MNTSTVTSRPENTPTPTNPGTNKLKRLEIGFLLLAMALGLVHAWAEHHYLINADAMSYLDIAEAYLRGDLQTAINSYWSPLYSWLIALSMLVVRPSTYWKFAVVHLVNFGIYLFAFGCFGFLIRETMRRLQKQRAELLTSGFVIIPDWALLALGYSLFIWSSLFLVTVQLESPDMLVAAFIYLASALILRIRRHPSSWGLFLLLGVVLGLGYLAKSVMLPLAPVFMAAGVFPAGPMRRALPRLAVTVAVFIIVAGPFVFALSQAKGRFTTGGSGDLNYLWSINRITNTHWQGEDPSSGQPKHPTRKIFDNPPVFEFGEPVGGTYPVWYDPTYWYEGSVSHFDLREQIRVFVEAVKAYYELFHNLGLQYALLVGLLTLYIMGGDRRLLAAGLLQQWSLIVPALAGLGLYSLVTVQGRYVASFIVLLWLALFAAVRLRHTPESMRLIKTIPLILVGLIIFTIVASSSREATSTLRQLVAGEYPSSHEQWQVAEGLRELGVVPNDRVAFIGESFRAFWAHLLGVRIVAEVKRERVDDFWNADASVKRQVIKAFADASVKAVVAGNPPVGTDLSGWQRIRGTNYYVYTLSP